MKDGITVSERFLSMLVTRYEAYLGQKEVQRARTKYVRKNYDTRKLTKELRKIHADLITADSVEIQRLRKRYLELREEIDKIREARDKDPVYQELKIKNKALREAVLKLDEAIMTELRKMGYEIKPATEPEEVKAKIREFNPNVRDISDEDVDGVAVAETKP